MIEIEHRELNNCIILRVSDVVTSRQLEFAVPEIEHAMGLAHGPLQILVLLRDFRGWTLGALWRQLELELRHRGDFGRIAVVGDSTLEGWGTALTGALAGAELRYFDAEQEREARRWLGAGT